MKLKTRKIADVQVGMRSRSAAFVPTTVVEEARTVEVVFSTGAKGERYSWEQGFYFEELSMDPASVRLERLNAGAPFLKNHNSYEVESVIGVVVRAWVEGGEGRAIVKLSDREDTNWIWNDMKAGILRNVSVGYNPGKYVDVSLPNDEVRTFRAVDWEPMEISLVPIPFDTKAQVRSGGGKVRTIEVVVEEQEKEQSIGQETEILTIPDERNHEMTPEEIEKQKQEAAAAASKDATKQERTRALDIKAAVRSAKLDAAVADELIADGTDINEARKQIIERMATQATSVVVEPRIEVGDKNEAEEKREAMSLAILHRANPSANVLTDHAREFRGMNLNDMAREVLDSNHVKTRGMTKYQIAKRALSTSDFPQLLGNVARRSLRAGYEVVPQTFRPFVREGTLSDYKEASVISFGDISDLELIREGSEYKMGTLGEGAEKVKLAKYGKIIPISDVVIVNDDLGMISRIPQMMGAAAARLESKLVYTDTLMGNPLMADGIALFHANHGNLGTPGAIAEGTVSGLEALMMAQASLDGADFLNIMPKFLVTGIAYKVAAQKLLGSMQSTKSTDVNPYAGAFQHIVDPRVTGNAWFFIADPSQIDTIELDYLEGEQGPTLDSEVEFMTDAVNFKIRHIVGVKAIDYRGMAKNVGAA